MRNWAIALSVVSIIMMGGCLPFSLHPLTTPDRVVFDSNLIGAWQESENKSIWEFQKAEGKTYTLQYTEKGKRGEFTAKLFDLDGTLFLELKPNEMDFELADYYRWHLLPVYSIVKVETINPLKLNFINYEWFSNTLIDQPDSLAHELVSGYGGSDDKLAVLTASPEEQQKFWKQHKNNPDAFMDPIQFQRIQ